MKNRLADPKKNEEINAKRRLFLKENNERLKQDQKNSYYKHREKRLEYQKNRRANDELRKQINKKAYQAKKKRLKTDSFFAFKHSIACLLRVTINRLEKIKKSKTKEILGCDWLTLKTHIERQFLKGMTWENRSEWHIDHIIPISSAKTEEDVIKLNHYTNLRPLWVADNLRKSNKLETLL